MEKLIIIIPAYNEEKRIGRTLEQYGLFFNLLKKMKKLDYEILVVINNTKDRTQEVVKAYMKKNKNIRYLDFKQGGKGFAVAEGFKEALRKENDFIGFTDADLATSPEEFYRLVISIKGVDGVISSRYLPESRILPRPSFRTKIVSRLFNFLVRSLFFINYKDTQCGSKVFRRDTIKRIIKDLSVTQWAFDIDLLYHLKKSKARIKEVAISWTEQAGSKINVLKSSMQMFFAVVQLRIINSPFRVLLRPLKSIIRPLWRRIK